MKRTSNTVRRSLLLLACIASSLSAAISQAAENEKDSSTTLWYKQPAKIWSEAMPLGNGRLGAMLFGGPDKERILINEETVWTGGPYNPTNYQGASHLAEIQKLVFDGDYAKAHKWFGRYMMGTPVEQMKYQPLGDLWLNFPGHEEATDYRRDLDLETAVASVSYRVGNVEFVREALVSPVDQVIAIRLGATKRGQISFTAQLTGYRNVAHSNYGSEFYRMDGVGADSLQLYGRTSEHLGVDGRVRFFARAKFIPEGGKIEIDYDSLRVTGADRVTILIPAATNFVSYRDVSANAAQRVMDVLRNLDGKSYHDIRADHVAAHQDLFRRAEMSLGKTEVSSLPTDERCKAFASGEDDPDLAALYFHFGRYLLISSSRPGTKPANLQGIWNEEMNPSWDSKYTTNINLEMNYWPVEVANLSECAEPLIKMMCEITTPGSITAKHSYGARGWVLHQNTDIWWATAPMDGPSWGTFSTGGAWLCTHLWEHYQYNPDPEYLERIYPVLRGAALFFLDTLVEHPTGKVLVTNPATSPENVPTRPGNREIHDEIMGGNITPNICAGPTMDMQILRDLFDSVIEASKILDRDKELREEIAATQARLAPMKIGRHGQLQEWFDDWDDPNDTHRHFSHLYGMFPSNQITLEATPTLAAAARNAVIMRGDFGTGFSMAWKMGLWARLRDGNRAHVLFRNLIDKNTCVNLFSKCFSTPQVEGAFGACATLVEMLMQSHGGEIRLLPALPSAWPQGTIRGIRARGGYVIDLAWDKGQLTSAKILATRDGPCRVRYGKTVVTIQARAGKSHELTAASFTSR